VIRESRLGRVEFRVDKTSNIHVPVGKTSFSQDKLLVNFATLMEAIVGAEDLPRVIRESRLGRVEFRVGPRTFMSYELPG
jgi:hypothetical protein